MSTRFLILSPLSSLALIVGCSSDPELKDATKPEPVTNECSVATSGPTVHSGEVKGNEVWTAAGSPHIVEYDVNVRDGATLTIEPCARVQIKKDRGIRVAYPITPNTGSLIAEGTASRPITIDGLDGARWGQLFVHAPGKARFKYVTITGGGGNSSPSDASLVVYGDGTLPSKHDVLLDHVTVTKSLGVGVKFDRGAGFDPASTDLTIKESGTFPLEVGEHALNTIPTGSYVGNGKDLILMEMETVDATLGLQESGTIHERGVPYQIGTSPGLDHLRITGKKNETPVTLTIEPGVTIKFLKGSAFKIEHFTGDFDAPAIVHAVGTKEKPITFTSVEATPRAGDWQGLWFGGKPRAENRIENVRIEYTGADCGCILLTCNSITQFEGAVIFSMPPTNAFIKNTVFAHGSSHAIVNGYDGVSPDFASVNTFEDMAGCAQTLPRTATCPSPRPTSG
jgi:hypothetical protein